MVHCKRNQEYQKHDNKAKGGIPRESAFFVHYGSNKQRYQSQDK